MLTEGVGAVIRVLIADNNVELCDILTRYFERQNDIEVAGVAYDGEQALNLIEEVEPDVVILDITMPILDGLAVLERLPNLNIAKRPKIIILSAFGREDLILKLTQLGADYYVVKPFDMEVLVTRIRQFAGDDDPLFKNSQLTAGTHAAATSKQDLLTMVTEIIHGMGVPAHFKGYNYLRDAVMMVLTEKFVPGGNLTKELYPRIAAKYNTTTGGVEAAIRNAILTAWEHGNRDYISKIVGKSAISTKGKFPSNSLMIAKIADQLRIRMTDAS
ncbi:MAG: sporulation transcription factor Spo0A [Firmicutes bacterium]|nr:sporulation transcription factor Spo0A [Bacillota bacterium]